MRSLDDLVCVVATRRDELLEQLSEELLKDGCDVWQATSTPKLVARVARPEVGLLVVGELEAPGVQPRVLRGLRSGRLGERAVDPNLPVVAVVEERGLVATLRAFDAGADDVLVAPVDPAELRARVTALHDRAVRAGAPKCHRVGHLTIDLAARHVAVDGHAVKVSGKEWALLVRLASEPTRVFTKHQLLREIWQRDGGPTRTLDSHAWRLRVKLAEAGARNYVVTVWGVGYKLAEPHVLAAAA